MKEFVVIVGFHWNICIHICRRATRHHYNTLAQEVKVAMAVLLGITCAYACVWLTHLVQWHTGNWGRFFTRDVKMWIKKKPTTKQLFFTGLEIEVTEKKHMHTLSLNSNCSMAYKYFCICFFLFFFMADFRSKNRLILINPRAFFLSFYFFIL